MPRAQKILVAVAVLALVAQVLYLLLGGAAREDPPVPAAGAEPASAMTGPETGVRPSSSAAQAFVRSMQSRQLALPLRRKRELRLAFGRDMIGRLTDDGVTLHALPSGEVAGELELQAPRAILSLADGAILAIGARAMVRLEAGKKPLFLARPVLWPTSEVFADAQLADRLWVFEVEGSAPALSSFRVERDRAHGVLLPEQQIAIDAPPGGELGQTREGVWLYFGAGRVERLGPSGARLTPLRLPSMPDRFAILPARRLDQANLLREDGTVVRALVSPVFKRLGEANLLPAPLTADVGDEGRLLAAIGVTGAGPRFELFLFDEKLSLVARAPLPADEPTGRDDWAAAVTRNQQLAVAPHRSLVAVGGPDRLMIFDGRAQQVLSIPSR